MTATALCPPADLAPVLLQIARKIRFERVVDLGCGPGLSTRFWADHANEVIGIDPSPDMLSQAEAVPHPAHIYYREGLGQDTQLPDGCADLVTASQSLHWMEPDLL